jgi:hypothetical protein
MKNTEYYKNISPYQKSIVDFIINGGIVDFNEGTNYKVWKIKLDGTKEFIRRDSADKIFSHESFKYFSFTDKGIILKNK